VVKSTVLNGFHRGAVDVNFCWPHPLDGTANLEQRPMILSIGLFNTKILVNSKELLKRSSGAEDIASWTEML
jgi:hypothetical protein